MGQDQQKEQQSKGNGKGKKIGICEQCQKEAGRANPKYQKILCFVRERSKGYLISIVTCADYTTSHGLQTRRRQACFDNKDCAAIRQKAVKKKLLEDIGAYDVPGNGNAATSKTTKHHSDIHDLPFPARNGRVSPHRAHGHE